MVLVRSVDVIPDFTNRAQTGISVEHAHFVASSIRDKGFQKRVPPRGAQKTAGSGAWDGNEKTTRRRSKPH